jgi:hypothetical protein
MVYEQNKELNECKKILYDFFKDKEYGVSFSWEEIKKVLVGYKLNKQQLYLVLSIVNKMLVTDQRQLETIHGWGKRILCPKEHVGASRKVIKQATKKYRHAGRIINATNMEMLSEDEKREAIDAANKWRTLELFTNELTKKKQITDDHVDPRTAKTVMDVIKLLSNK